MPRSENKQTDTVRTHPETRRIALVFDFDATLAPDTWDGFLNHLGLNPEQFDAEHVDPLVKDGWDKIPAKFHALIQESGRRKEKITREMLTEYGRGLKPFEGVPDMFRLIRERAACTAADVTVEFYIVSSGFGDIIRATDVASEFDGIWGCDFHFAENGEIAFPKVILAHTEKPRYLHLIEKGVEQYRDRPPHEVFRQLPEEELYVPLDQMVYVGDGSSDVACFALVNTGHGIALGVNKPGTPVHWGQNGIDSRERINNIAPPDYRRDSELLRSLELAVDSICARIMLAGLSNDD